MKAVARHAGKLFELSAMGMRIIELEERKRFAGRMSEFC